MEEKRSKRVLVVDDEPNIVMTVADRLELNGYEVITAGDGMEALEKAKNEKPDLIILDLMLPKMDGYKVCRDLKNDLEYKHIPIIMFTAKTMAADEILGLEMGADEYVKKPFELEELVKMIRGYIR